MSSRPHPNDMTCQQLACEARGMAGTAAMLRDHLRVALDRDLPAAELRAAADEAQQIAYQIAYHEQIPTESLHRARREGAACRPGP